MSAQIRKLYIDSRIGCTGNPSDFTFQLPSAVPTTVDEGIVISQLNMPNLFTTVMADFSDRLYFSLNLQDQLGLVTGLNNRIYVRTRIFSPGAGIAFTGYILTISPGTYRRSVPTSRRSKRRSQRSGPPGRYRRKVPSTRSLPIPP